MQNWCQVSGGPRKTVVLELPLECHSGVGHNYTDKELVPDGPVETGICNLQLEWKESSNASFWRIHLSVEGSLTAGLIGKPPRRFPIPPASFRHRAWSRPPWARTLDLRRASIARDIEPSTAVVGAECYVRLYFQTSPNTVNLMLDFFDFLAGMLQILFVP